jgi:hypothetical protein
MNKAPVIGSYKKPQVPEQEVDLEIVDKRQKVETPATSLSTGVQEDLKDSIDRTKDGVEKSKSYDEILSEHDITVQKAHTVVDAMLEKGFYEESIPITKSVSATFRTRAHADYVRYLRALETYNPKYVEEQQEIQIRYFLAASLVSFKGVTFKIASGEDVEKFFDRKLEWIEGQPETVIRLIAVKLSKFDQQIQTIMSEGIVENF